MDRLLQGLTVLEAADGVAVRYCGRLFAQLGATVVRRADADADDRLIGYAGEAGHAYGRWLDAGKLADRADRPVDLVIGGQDQEGVTEGALLADAHAAVLLAITWFHRDGPYGGWRGTDELIQGLTGVAYPFGLPEGPPILAQGHGPQVVAGLVAFNAALGALFARPRPRRVDVNIYEAYMCLTETGAVSALMEGGGAVRLGVNRFVPTYPCTSYRTADGWAGVSTLTPAQWRGLCGMIGRPDLAEDPRFATTMERLLLADEIDALVAPRFLARTTDEWVAAADAARVPLTAMPSLRELPETPHWRDRGAFGGFDHLDLTAPTLPYRMRFHPGAPSFEGKLPEAPLRGLRVVDFSMGWAGPLCTRTLGDLGADVVKVESDTHPDWWRGWETDQSGDPPPMETKFSFISMNRNKRGIVLDLFSPEGLSRARKLIARADVVVENFAAGVMEKLGLGADARRALNPGLVAISMPAFGNGGPLSGIRAYGSTVEQASGLPFANGFDAWPPCLQHVAFGDPIAGLYATSAVLAALYARGRQGGAEIDLAQVACLFQLGADALIAQQLTSTPLPRTGSRRPRAAPVVVVNAGSEDAWLAVVVEGPEAWQGLCRILDRADWAAAEDLADRVGRDRRADEIEAAVAEWARLLEPEIAAERLQREGVAAAPVFRADVLAYAEQLSAGGFWPEMERRYVGRHVMPAAPFAYDGKRPELRRPAPTLGEHTGEVLRELDAGAGSTA